MADVALSVLTKGACLKLRDGEKLERPVFQFLGYREFVRRNLKDPATGAVQRKKILLSDGEKSLQVILSNTYHTIKANPSLQRFKFYSLEIYDNSKIVEGRRLIIVYEVGTISVGKEIRNAVGQVTEINECVYPIFRRGPPSEDRAYVRAANKLCIELEDKFRKDYRQVMNCCDYCDCKLLNKWDLTKRAVLNLLSGSKIENPILQVVESLHCVETDKFWLLVTDGDKSCVARIHENFLICAREEIPKKTIIQVNSHKSVKAACGGFEVIIMDFDIIETGDMISKFIGDPEMSQFSIDMPEVSKKPRRLKLTHSEDQPRNPTLASASKYYKDLGVFTEEIREPIAENFIQEARKTVICGIIERIFRREEYIRHPFLQVCEYVHVKEGKFKGTYHILMSDGIQLTSGMLCPRLNREYMKSGKLRKLDLVELIRYTCNNSEDNTKMIVIHKIGRIIHGETIVDFKQLPDYSDKLPVVDEVDALDTLANSLETDAILKFGLRGDPRTEMPKPSKSRTRRQKNESFLPAEQILTVGSIEKLLNKVYVKSPVVQLLVLRKVLLGREKQYGAIIADGYDIMTVLLSSDLNDSCSRNLDDNAVIELKQYSYTLIGEDTPSLDMNRLNDAKAFRPARHILQIDKIGYSIPASHIKKPIGKPEYVWNRYTQKVEALYYPQIYLYSDAGIAAMKSISPLKNPLSVREALEVAEEAAAVIEISLSAKAARLASKRGGLRLDISHILPQTLKTGVIEVEAMALVRKTTNSTLPDVRIIRCPPISGFSRFADEWHENIDLLCGKKKGYGRSNFDHQQNGSVS